MNLDLNVLRSAGSLRLLKVRALLHALQARQRTIGIACKGYVPWGLRVFSVDLRHTPEAAESEQSLAHRLLNVRGAVGHAMSLPSLSFRGPPRDAR